MIDANLTSFMFVENYTNNPMHTYLTKNNSSIFSKKQAKANH
jgi:hypothetical protein